MRGKKWEDLETEVIPAPFVEVRYRCIYNFVFFNRRATYITPNTKHPGASPPPHTHTQHSSTTQQTRSPHLPIHPPSHPNTLSFITKHPTHSPASRCPSAC